jgi:hypothetical protein
MDCGISIRPDGIQNTMINVKGIASDTLDWANWEKQEDVTIKSEDHEEIPVWSDGLNELLLGSEALISAAHYSFIKRDELKQLCRWRGFLVGGNKSQLIERLQAYDIKHP